MNIIIFRGFFGFFMNFSELKIDFSNFEIDFISAQATWNNLECPIKS